MLRGEFEIGLAQAAAMPEQDRFNHMNCWLSRSLRDQPSKLRPTLSFGTLCFRESESNDFAREKTTPSSKSVDTNCSEKKCTLFEYSAVSPH